MPPADKAKMAWAMLHYKMKMEDGVRLYGKYVGNWGGEATRWRFDAKKNGKVVKSVTRCPGSRLHLAASASSLKLTEANTWDAAAVRITVRDEFDNLTPYAQLPVRFTVTGDARLIGPGSMSAEGGMCGTYVRTCLPEGKTAGEAVMTIEAEGLEPVTMHFSVRRA